MSATPLHLLFVEDRSDDAELVLHELRRGGYAPKFEVVCTAEAMESALERRKWDLVLSDFEVPGFGAAAALEIVKARGLDLPFLVVSGAIDDETAVTLMKAGAHDFLSKGRLVRLCPAIARELRDADSRRARREAEERARRSEEAQRQALFQESLLSVVSHELRTPLSSLVGFTELLLSRDFPLERRRELLNVLHSESLRLARLVDDFLDVQRLQSGRLTWRFEPLELGPLLAATRQTFASRGDDRRIRLELESDLPEIVADADRLRQVFTNLLANALKFSRADAEVVVRARARERELEVAVVDHGVGIPEAAVPQLFTKFFRVESEATRGVGGTGLGLAIVKEIVEAHDGRVEVESRLGVGSTFRVVLPVAAAVATQSEPSPSDVALQR